MKKFIASALLISCLFSPSAKAEEVARFMLWSFLDSFQVNTTTLPRVYISWNSPTFGSKYCTYVDFGRMSEVPREKMALGSYIRDKLLPTFGNPPLAPDEEAEHCYGGATIVPWKVEYNGGLKDRPSYDLAIYLKDGRWVTNGRVNLLTKGFPTICDAEVIRTTPGYSYHKAPNKSGVVSLTACTQ